MDQQLLEVVVCPVTRSRLRVEGEFLISEVGGIKYPIKDGIPVLIAEQAVLPEGKTSLEEAKKKFQR
jgi:uncharacterized protein YbaR (Trm112 family)